MKAITIWQPWASLIACGNKKYETRSWATKYRGPIAIHAGKFGFGPYDCELPIGFTDTAVNVLWPGTADPCTITDNWNELPKGKIIATAELVDCHRIRIDKKTHRIILLGSDGMQSSIPLTSHELLFGDWTPGRYAWELTNVSMIDKFISVKGKQGLWNWEN